MDLNKYIDENLDEILENTDEYIGTYTKTPETKKQVSWKEEIAETSRMIDTQNEDIATNEEIQAELFEDYYDKKLQREYLKSIGEDVPDSDDEETEEEKKEKISEHRVNLLNLFLIHYNEKFEKKENYFTNIKNIEKDTTSSMELFFESVVEFKKLKDKLKLDDDEECMDYYYEENDENKKEINQMLKDFSEEQIYCLNYNNKNIITPSILICLNYLINNKEDIYGEKDWNIFNLRKY